jgi:hypothetical protein
MINDKHIYTRFPLNLDTLFEKVLAMVGVGLLAWVIIRS